MPVIVISGEPEAGTSTTSKLLAEKLNLRRWSVGDWTKAQAKEGKPTERAVKIWEEELGKPIEERKREIHGPREAAQEAEAKKGNVVIDSKLGVHFIGHLADLKVWLTCPPEERARRVAERDHIPLEEAKKVAKEKEHLERDSWKQIYGFDYFDQSKQADLVIDTSKNDPEQAVAKILAALDDKLGAKKGHKVYDKRKFL